MSRCWPPCICKCCDCSLKTFGFVYGWMGVIWRIVVTMFVAMILSKTTPYDPNLYNIFLGTTIVYIQLSLLTNLFFLIGIQKDKPYFLLPFTVVGCMELCFGAGILIFLIVLLAGTWLDYLLSAIIPITLVVLGLYSYFWVRSIELYKQMEKEITRKREENERLASIRQYIAH